MEMLRRGEEDPEPNVQNLDVFAKAVSAPARKAREGRPQESVYPQPYPLAGRGPGT